MNRRQTFLVGLTSVLALIILAGLLMAFGEFDRLLTAAYPVTISTDDAAGLRPGSAVTLNGVPIGRIGSVGLQPNPEYPVRVTALIEEEHLLPEGTEFIIQQGLLGGASILSLQSSGREAFLPKDGSAEIRGVHVPMFEQLNQTFTARFQPLLDAMDELEALGRTYRTLGERLNHLVGAEPADLDAGEAGNLHNAVHRLNALMDDAAVTIASADRWLGDDALRTDVHSAVTRADAVLEDAGATMRRYTALADTLEADAGRIVEQLATVSDQLSVAMEDVHQITRLASSGEGTIGQLLNNPDLYNSLNDAAIRLERALVEFQLLMQKIAAEGLPVDF